MQRTSRRQFLALAGAGLGVAALWPRLRGPEDEQVLAAHIATLTPARTPVPVQTPALPTPVPTPTPPPLKPRGVETVTLMQGTEWETAGVEFSSGVRGTRVMVLGGVHGNEPGGWLAAEEIAHWEVAQGSMLVVPRANRLSTVALQRTMEGFGDLNRLYPGDRESDEPMARMAAEVVDLARLFQPHLLLDLHESWGFYQERGSNGGTAFIGQTVSVGALGEPIERLAAVVEEVNAQITSREQLTLRARTSRNVPQASPPRSLDPGRSTATPRPGASPRSRNNIFGGRTSLSLGNWVHGCVPVLIEMGQQDQPDSRRSALHQLLVRTTLQQSDML
ncbi:MAG: succinylglutamate desuccinylase/aspartoacylase family protein [Dehalococcoidia bacterium]